MYIGPARTEQDVEQAINLATKTFRSKENFEIEVRNKQFIIFQNHNCNLEDVIVISDLSTGVIGACFLIDRVFYKNDSVLKGTFLSSICISESNRGKGLSKLLLNYAITEVENRSSDFAILIARRAVDYFYNQFNFWGVAQYNKISYKTSLSEQSSNPVLFFDAKEEDLQEINELYSSTYSSLFGSCKRSDSYWSYILKKSALLDCNIIICRLNDKVDGYIIYSGSEVYEFASTKSLSCFHMLNSFGHRFCLDSLTLHCSSKHPLVNELQNIDFSLTKRQCNYGGHMVRITNYNSLLEKLTAECKSKLENLGIKDYVERKKGHYSLDVQNGALSLKLVDSPISYSSTSFLMGIECLSETSKQLSIFETQSFNVPLFDQI